jgi:Tol biopolymer transport system component
VYQKENRYGNRLFKIRPNGSDRTYLSKGCGRFFPDNKRRCGDGYATWFPSGKRLALERELCGTGSTNLIAIYAMRADGTHDRRITHKSATCATSHRYADFAPTVAPSGKRLAFARGDNKRGKHAIFIVRLDGTRMRRVTPWWMDADQPDWAPNGRWITFRTQSESETKGNIALVHPNGKDLHRITNSGGKAKWLSNSFSPNGRRIVAGRVPGSGEAGRADLYVTKLDGSDRRNLTRSNPWESAPDWGPRRH